MKPNRFMLIVSIFTILVILIGSTFAYFSVSSSSTDNAVTMEAAVINIKLDVLPLYTGKALIPTNNTDIDTAYQNHCVDMYDNGACSAYTIRLKNDGDDNEYIGTINFTLENITHFNYRLLDNDGNVYQDTVIVQAGTNQELGSKFILESGAEKTFTLIVWLPNFNYEQDTEDANGHFSANITYASSFGSKVTGTFSS